ncbi:EamA family transporter [Algoriphagus sp. CAU 1675]|uniref:DMT family transporter n=1 Tax=Algoriphagus sp. CAU 1675 TaxID=3032597 RepID=UPI0023DACC4A|nr:EamA family transporter [Algoriphagus sp. CAU 1675]MDF2157659.1 EamA family transporter [Algoriphagus sp. CAU 1675]
MTALAHPKTFSALAMALSAAIFWGVSGTCAQFLFEQKGIDPAWLVGCRLLIAGILLILFSIAKRDPDVVRIWKNRKDLIQLLIFSILGMVAVQFTYFYSINLSNAATATVLQYIGPLFVVAFYAIKHRRWPLVLEYASLGLALSGTFLLVTHGSFEELVISQQALLWGILSAISLAFYTIHPVQLLKKYSPGSVTGWAMLIGGLAFSFYSKPLQISGTWDMETWLAFAYIILIGSILAFYIFLTSITIIGATTASLMCSVEPLAAALVAVFWLGVSFQAMDWLGTLFILITIILLTLGTKKKKSLL